jgi:hypothetical protein
VIEIEKFTLAFGLDVANFSIITLGMLRSSKWHAPERALGVGPKVIDLVAAKIKVARSVAEANDDLR